MKWVRATLLTGWVAWLQSKSIDEQVEEDSVAAGGSRVGVSSVRETVCANKASVDVVQQVGPYFTDICIVALECNIKVYKSFVTPTVDFIERLQA